MKQLQQGLGTFGLSKGLITEKGIAGRSVASLKNWSCLLIKGCMKTFMITVPYVECVEKIVQSMRYLWIREKTTYFVLNS
jgi:hypothetical protein